MLINITKDDRDKSGIYQIHNSFNDKVYIGQTVNFAQRARQHKSKLTRNLHNNYYLQSEYSKNPECFTFSILEITPIENLNEIETSHLKKYYDNWDNCYNFEKQPNDSKRGIRNLSEAVKKSWENPERKELAKKKMQEFNEENKEKIRKSKLKTYKFYSPNKEFIVVEDLIKFCNENNLNTNVMRGLCNGRYIQHQNWTSANLIKEKKIIKRNDGKYKFIHTDGTIISPENMAEFSRKYNLNRRSIFRLIKGKKKLYKGWKFIKPE